MEKIKRICPICGDRFIPFGEYTNKKTGYSRKQKYCSKECWNKRNPKSTKICPVCNNSFDTYIREKIYCSLECRNIGMRGKKLSQETKDKMSKAKQGYMPVNIFLSGDKHPFWLKDRSKVAFIETPEYNKFRKRILKRDNYTCQHCGRRGKAGYRPILDVHHIKSRKNYPNLALDESNCITLCRECHKKTNSYLKRWNTGMEAVKV